MAFVSRCFMLMMALLAPFAMGASGPDQITLVSSTETKESMYGRWLELIYRDAFTRLGYRFTYLGYPGGRAPYLAARGEVDGEIHRPAIYQSQTQALLRVPESHFPLSYEVYTALPNIRLSGWQSLQPTSYRVEYRRGAKLPEIELGKVVSGERLSTIGTVAQGMNKLLKGRSDIYVEQSMIARQALQHLVVHSVDYQRIYSAGVMITADSFVYLHRRHQSMLGPLAAVLKQMKQEGVIERYRKLALQESGTTTLAPPSAPTSP
ncbi:hypothetical protein [Aeromonas veronii]|uniref:hypothetical protein n=1 Tax=Aeromonas TaxID=642 RepID=UPI0032EB3098